MKHTYGELGSSDCGPWVKKIAFVRYCSRRDKNWMREKEQMARNYGDFET